MVAEQRWMVRAVSAVAAVIVAGAAIAGCGSDSPAAQSALVSMSSERGMVEIPGDPERLFGMYTSDLDIAITLGLPLAPVQSIRNGSDAFPDFLPADKLTGITALVNYPDFNYEAIAAADPDVILNSLGFEGGPDLGNLGKIAPTFTYDGFKGNWLDKFKLVAEAFDKTEQYDEYIVKLNARYDDLRAQLAGAELPVVLYGGPNPDGGAGFYGSANSAPVMNTMRELGMVAPGGATDRWVELSDENLLQVANADIIIVPVEATEDQAAALKQINDNPTWQALPAVQAGQVYAVNNELSYSSPYAELAFIDEFERILAEWLKQP